MKTLFASLILIATVSLNSVAQDSAQRGLPEGAKARLDVGFVHDLEFSPDGICLAIESNSGLWLYDVATDGAPTLKWKHNSPVDSVAFSPDGRSIVSGNGGCAFRDAATGVRIKRGPNYRHPEIPEMVKIHAFSPDGRTIAGGGEYNVYVWDGVSGALKYTWEVELGMLYYHTGELDCLAFSPDGKTLAAGHRSPRPSVHSSRSGTIFLRNVVTGELDHELDFSGVPTSLAFSPDGRTLAWGTWFAKAGFDTVGWVNLWDVVIGGEKGGLSPRQFDYGIIDIIHSVAYSPDNRTVAGGGEEDIYIWDAVTEAPIHILEGHSHVVKSVAFSPDGRTLASGSIGGTVYLWEITPLADPRQVVKPPIVGPLKAAPDVNGDGGVDIQDLLLVVGRLGQSARVRADVNGDEIVNVLDVALVAGMVDDLTDIQPMYHDGTVMPRIAEVKLWIEGARKSDLPKPISLRSIQFLQNLLATLTPNETALLPNYPNPFNPETWIPYQLARDTGVQISIYSAKGLLVRQLDLGRQAAGYYTGKHNAAYWDGRNEGGELVTNGVYVYEFRAGDYRASGRMAIVK